MDYPSAVGNGDDRHDEEPAEAAAAAEGEEDEGSDISFDEDDGEEGAKVPAIGEWPGEDGGEGGGGGGGGYFAAQDNAGATVPTLPLMPNFVVSDVREKNANGALLCLVVGCTKNAQGRSFSPKTAGDSSLRVPPRAQGGGGLCRAHHNAYLIQTGQVESWDCACGNRVIVESDRCGSCHRWRGGVKQHNKTTATGSAKKAKTSYSATSTRTAPPEGAVPDPWAQQGDGNDIRISDVRETNKNGRSLCKVVGCTKLDQARNAGFCRRHYKMVAVVDGASSSSLQHDASEKNAGGDVVLAGGGVDVDLDSWTCPCGQVISFKMKRCGKCNKASSIDYIPCILLLIHFLIYSLIILIEQWKGGMREPYKVTTSAKKRRVLSDNVKIKDHYDDVSSNWTCQCGSEVSATKSRCGKCHHWRGGKRKGGWTIRPSSNAVQNDYGIDWSADWICCEETISADKRRCGKCNGWRGGKRVAKTSLKSEEGDVRNEYATTEFTV
ncbi:hypothetical protein ACHAW5_003135 [Stephanodiscus triporus]|uniref:RanBP2-type domain-containing protein n=1 Tax=Stephanodiscus triporus TaxID=2934178 RepID=A0ABD3PFT3_9STRA